MGGVRGSLMPSFIPLSSPPPSLPPSFRPSRKSSDAAAVVNNEEVALPPSLPPSLPTRDRKRDRLRRFVFSSLPWGKGEAAEEGAEEGGGRRSRRRKRNDGYVQGEEGGREGRVAYRGTHTHFLPPSLPPLLSNDPNSLARGLGLKGGETEAALTQTFGGIGMTPELGPLRVRKLGKRERGK